MKHCFLLVAAFVACLASCSEYDGSFIREYTPEAIDDNSWTADIDTTIIEDNDVPGLPPNDPEFRNTLVSLLSAQYDGILTVTINGISTDPTEQHVIFRVVDGNHINFGLKNFLLIDEYSVMPVGTIVLKNIEIKDEGNGNVSFNFSQSINILPGDHEIEFEGESVEMTDDDWLGPQLGPIPVTIKGIGNLNTMNIGIDIVMESLGQTVHVDFIKQ